MNVKQIHKTFKDFLFVKILTESLCLSEDAK